jgi:hypothetical protein
MGFLDFLGGIFNGLSNRSFQKYLSSWSLPIDFIFTIAGQSVVAGCFLNIGAMLVVVPQKKTRILQTQNPTILKSCLFFQDN